MRKTSGLLLLVLVMSCQRTDDSGQERYLRDLCEVASMPAGTAAERTALVVAAKQRWEASLPVVVERTGRTRAVLAAASDLVAVGYRAVPPSGAPTPLASLWAEGTEGPIKAARIKLLRACQ